MNKINIIFTMTIAVFFFTTVTFAFLYFQERTPWTGIVLPSLANPSDDIVLGRFPNLKACQTAGQKMVSALKKDGVMVYKCGEGRPIPNFLGLNFFEKVVRVEVGRTF